MQALLVDAGNTRVAFAAWTPGDGHARRDGDRWVPPRPLQRLGALPTPGRDGETAFRTEAGRLLQAAGGAPVVLVSVVPRVSALLLDLAPALLPADHRAALPFEHRLADPAATGADRLCNMAAAVAAGLRSALVVDVGTATTVDVLRDGVHEGGVIAPGMAFALQQIGTRAARLAPVPFGPVPLVAGRDTAAALAAGGYHAGVGGVEALIAGLQGAHGPLPVVVTGGLAGCLQAPGRLLDPDWTLRGAARLYGIS
ncbi:MAG: type III pantothenate kinase [bacterium]|nr:type III pantothenate kinase [bacterium]